MELFLCTAASANSWFHQGDLECDSHTANLLYCRIKYDLYEGSTCECNFSQQVLDLWRHPKFIQVQAEINTLTVTVNIKQQKVWRTSVFTGHEAYVLDLNQGECIWYVLWRVVLAQITTTPSGKPRSNLSRRGQTSCWKLHKTFIFPQVADK